MKDAALTIAFIGGGNMARALASGLIGGQCAADHLQVVDPSEAARAHWKTLGAHAHAAPGAALADCRVWFFAVKPQDMAAAVEACRPWLRADTLVISVAAGLPARALAGWLGSDARPHTQVVRCMPNTPALIGRGVTGMTALADTGTAERALAETLLGAVGDVVWVADDSAIDAVTAVSGSGPAYVFLFLEALTDAGVALGLSPDESHRLALATLQGAAELAARSADSPAVLRERVTSRGGTTAQALALFDARDFRGMMRDAVAAAAKRAEALARAHAK